MKSTISVICAGDAMSHPTRGAWIEIYIEQGENKMKRSHPTRGAWIEIQNQVAI